MKYFRELLSSNLEIAFFGFGYDGLTGEPDLIAMARASMTGEEMCERYRSRRAEKIKEGKKNDELSNLVEGPNVEPSYWALGQPPDRGPLRELCAFLYKYQLWSQPSDRVAVIATLARLYGHEAVLDALRAGPARITARP